MGWQAPESGSPVYRLYNPNSGEHFYTLSAYERDDLRKHGWNYESISFNSAANTGIPVYRVYNPNSGWHHYTLISYERDSLVKAGWRNEGVAWYAVNNGQTNNDNYRLLGFLIMTNMLWEHRVVVKELLYCKLCNIKEKLLTGAWYNF